MRTSGSRPHSYLIIVFSLAVLLTGCSSHRRSVRRGMSKAERLKVEHQIEKDVERSLAGDELRVVDEAFKWLETPYVFGKQDKGKGTDCSGMVMVVFEQTIGCKLPRNSAKQAEFCEEIKERQVKPGDLVFFITNKGSKINHVGIMIDEKQFIHASSHGVVVSSMETDYYKTHFQKYGRVPCMRH